eukprot:9477189-Pyramimonas_sp.AAC.2
MPPKARAPDHIAYRGGRSVEEKATEGITRKDTLLFLLQRVGQQQGDCRIRRAEGDGDRIKER